MPVLFFGQLHRLPERVADHLRQPRDSTQVDQLDVVPHQVGPNPDQVVGIEVHQGVDFRLGPLPVLDAERVQRQRLHAEIDAALGDGFRRLGPLAVSFVAGQILALRPAAVAIHDDGDVARQLLRVQPQPLRRLAEFLLHRLGLRHGIAHKYLSPDDGLASLRPHANHLDGLADNLFDPPDIGLRVLRQLLEGRRLTDILVPAGHLLVDGLGLGQPVDIGREERLPLAVDLVGRAEVQFLQSPERIQVQQRQRSRSIRS